MPTMSIEILCVGASKVDLPDVNEIGLDVTNPPRTDRNPSLWQDHMSSLGGVLVHLFDPEYKFQHRRWAYDIIAERDWSYFQFNKNVRDIIYEIIESLVSQSPKGKIYFYTDAQWSNEPQILVENQTISAFFSNHDLHWIRMNTAVGIVKG